MGSHLIIYSNKVVRPQFDYYLITSEKVIASQDEMVHTINGEEHVRSGHVQFVKLTSRHMTSNLFVRSVTMSIKWMGSPSIWRTS
jgi:hypothetical protein